MEDQGICHVPRRVRVLPFLERPGDDNQDAAEQLASAPRQSRRDGRADRVGHLDQELDDDREQREGRAAQDGHDDVRPCHAAPVAGAGHPDEDEVTEADERDGDPDREEVGLGPVDDRGRDGRGDQADDDEQRAGDARFLVAVPVRYEDLVEERRDGVEEADVNRERDQEEPEFELTEENPG